MNDESIPTQVGVAKRLTISEILIKQAQFINDIEERMAISKNPEPEQKPIQTNALEMIFEVITRNNKRLDTIRQSLSAI